MNDFKDAVKRQTSNLDLCAAWLASGAKVDPSKVDRSDSRHIRFTVEGCGLDLDRIEGEWVSRTLVINARDLLDALKDLKAIIYDRQTK